MIITNIRGRQNILGMMVQSSATGNITEGLSKFEQYVDSIMTTLHDRYTVFYFMIAKSAVTYLKTVKICTIIRFQYSFEIDPDIVTHFIWIGERFVADATNVLLQI